jgi:hypothetical protein
MKNSNEASDHELISNFNLMNIHCIGCGTELTSDDPRVQNREKEDTMVCTDYHKDIQSDFEPQSSRFAINCYICNNVGKSFALLHLIIENRN